MNHLEPGISNNSSSNLKKTTGFSLLIIGLSIGLWVITVIYRLLVNDPMVGLIDLFANVMDRTISLPSGEIVLPRGLFITAGYVVVCILLSVCAGISRALIQFGAHLIQRDLKALVTQLSKELKLSLNKKH